jgi:predicted NBD/HSP70 family sugar kinase
MTNTRTTVRELRRQNRQLLLQQTYFAQPISRHELSQQLGLSPATVTNVVADLIEEELLLETGVEESQGGRPRTLLTVNSRYGYFIGVDVGETQTQVELFDLNLRRLSGVHFPTEGDDLAAQVVSHITQGVAFVLESAALGEERVLGVGIGVPGVVERGDDELVQAPSWGWEPVPLKARLREQIALPIYIDNGAKAMAQAELWLGAGRSVESMAVLLIGTGVGASMIADGQIYRGATNSAGEWGHAKIMLDGWPCRCGGQGCLEAYVGAPGIMRQFRELAPTFPLPEDQEQAIAAIVAAYHDGQAAALQTIKQTAEYLGVSLGNLINLFNPELVILGGWAGLQIGPLMLTEMARVAGTCALPRPFEVVSFGMCELGLDAVCKGAATLVLEQFLSASGRPAVAVEPDNVRSRVPAALSGVHRSR